MPYDENGTFVPMVEPEQGEYQFTEEDIQLAEFLGQTVPSFVADIVHATNGAVLSFEEAAAIGEEMVSRLDADGVAELVEDINASYFAEQVSAEESAEETQEEAPEEAETKDAVELSEEDAFILSAAAVIQDSYAKNNAVMLSDTAAIEQAAAIINAATDEELVAFAEEIQGYEFAGGAEAVAGLEAAVERFGKHMTGKRKAAEIAGKKGGIIERFKAGYEGGRKERATLRDNARSDDKASKKGIEKYKASVSKKHGTTAGAAGLHFGRHTEKYGVGAAGLGLGASVWPGGKDTSTDEDEANNYDSKKNVKASEEFSEPDENIANRRKKALGRLQQYGYGTPDGVFF